MDPVSVAIAAIISASVTAGFKVPGAVASHWKAKKRKEQEQELLMTEMRFHFYPNHGTSLIDKVTAAAKDSAEALKVAQKTDASMENHIQLHLEQRR